MASFIFFLCAAVLSVFAFTQFLTFKIKLAKERMQERKTRSLRKESFDEIQSHLRANLHKYEKLVERRSVLKGAVQRMEKKIYH
jgi:CRISPR/Cas system CMR-associated protein Cmr5 small subunit